MSDQTRHIQAARSYVVYRQTPLPLFMAHGYCSPVISPDQSVLDREQGLVSKVVSVRRKWCNAVEQGVALAPSKQNNAATERGPQGIQGASHTQTACL